MKEPLATWTFALLCTFTGAAAGSILTYAGSGRQKASPPAVTTEKPKAIDTGGPAFPHGSYVATGMTLRQWYAGQVINGNEARGWARPADITHAFEIADAMIAAEKQP